MDDKIISWRRNHLRQFCINTILSKFHMNKRVNLLILFPLIALLSFSCSQSTPTFNQKLQQNEIPDSLYKEFFHDLSNLYARDYSNLLHIRNDSPQTFFSSDLVKSIQQNAIFKLDNSKKKYGKNIFNEDLLADSLAFIKAYPIQPNLTLGGGDPMYNRTTPGKFIPLADYHAFVAILKDKKSYGNSMAACFSPKIGLVMYDRESLPLGQISICLDCNQFTTSLKTPETASGPFAGFTLEARQKMRELFFKWGFDYYGYTHWDDSVAYHNYLMNK